MRLDLHIDRILVQGIDLGAADQAALKAALGAELQRLLSQTASPAGLLQSGGLHGRVAGGTIAAATRPTQLGREIAAAVHRGLVS
jgi:hypothetical protein